MMRAMSDSEVTEQRERRLLADSEHIMKARKFLQDADCPKDTIDWLYPAPSPQPEEKGNWHKPGCPRYSGVGECDCYNEPPSSEGPDIPDPSQLIACTNCSNFSFLVNGRDPLGIVLQCSKCGEQKLIERESVSSGGARDAEKFFEKWKETCGLDWTILRPAEACKFATDYLRAASSSPSTAPRCPKCGGQRMYLDMSLKGGLAVVCISEDGCEGERFPVNSPTDFAQFFPPSSLPSAEELARKRADLSNKHYWNAIDEHAHRFLIAEAQSYLNALAALSSGQQEG